MKQPFYSRYRYPLLALVLISVAWRGYAYWSTKADLGGRVEVSREERDRRGAEYAKNMERWAAERSSRAATGGAIASGEPAQPSLIKRRARVLYVAFANGATLRLEPAVTKTTGALTELARALRAACVAPAAAATGSCAAPVVVDAESWAMLTDCRKTQPFVIGEGLEVVRGVPTGRLAVRPSAAGPLTFVGGEPPTNDDAGVVKDVMFDPAVCAATAKTPPTDPVTSVAIRDVYVLTREIN